MDPLGQLLSSKFSQFFTTARFDIMTMTMVKYYSYYSHYCGYHNGEIWWKLSVSVMVYIHNGTTITTIRTARFLCRGTPKTRGYQALPSRVHPLEWDGYKTPQGSWQLIISIHSIDQETAEPYHFLIDWFKGYWSNTQKCKMSSYSKAKITCNTYGGKSNCLIIEILRHKPTNFDIKSLSLNQSVSDWQGHFWAVLNR